MSRILSPSEIKSIISPHHANRRLLKSKVSQEIITNLETVLKKLIDDYGLTNENLMIIVTTMMSSVGKYKSLMGWEKKELVILMIIKAIDERVELDNQVKAVLKITMQTVVPTAIDIMVGISKGKYTFTYLPKIKTWCKKIKCCC